jgi:aromatic-L-amino-acid/L-tryptophan decarboxylase
MIDRIKDLEKESRILEPGPGERADLREKVIEYTEGFLNNLHGLDVYVPGNVPDEEFPQMPIAEEPSESAKVIRFIYRNIDNIGLNPASGGYMGYIPGGGLYYSALGDYMVDVTNRFAGLKFACPGAVRMENELLRWMNDLIGFPSTASGNLTTGGSLLAIVTARGAAGLKASEIEKSVIYMSSQAHHSVAKAIRIAGLKEAKISYIPLDEGFRMIPGELEKAIERDREQGLKPWLVIAAAGTTDTGALDPLDAIGDICSKNNLWYHVDAAYGGFFILTEEGASRLKGIEKADSVVMDPHKGLFLPYGLGAVLVKSRQKLYESHYYTASYMQDTRNDMEELSPAELSPELTKHFRAMRLWLPLQLHGVKAFRACLEEKLLLARYFYSELKKLKGFEPGPGPDLSIVTFRYIPENADANEFNRKLVKALQLDGRVFLSSTTINGKFVIRLAVLSFRTHLDHVLQAIEVLKEKVRQLEADPENAALLN